MQTFRQTENNITKAIRQYLRIRGIEHFKHWGGPMSEPGVADLICCWKGRYLAIEVKTEKGAITDKQKNFLERISRAGGISIVARSVDDVIRVIEQSDPEVNLFSHARR